MKSIEIKKTLLIMISIVFFALALTTLVPSSSEVRLSLLNYKAVCPFSPFSTIIEIFMGCYFLNIVKKIRLN